MSKQAKKRLEEEKTSLVMNPGGKEIPTKAWLNIRR
jgi:hypothetical protein